VIASVLPTASVDVGTFKETPVAETCAGVLEVMVIVVLD